MCACAHTHTHTHTHTLWERSPRIKLINTSITSCIYLFFFFLSTSFKFYSLSKFRPYNTMLSSIVTMKYIGSSDHILSITESLYLFANLSYSSPSQTLATTFILSIARSLTFSSDFTCSSYHAVLVFVYSLS